MRERFILDKIRKLYEYYPPTIHATKSQRHIIAQELDSLSNEYNITENYINSIASYYIRNPHTIGSVTTTINYFWHILKSYGIDKEDFFEWIRNNFPVIFSKQSAIERKIVVLNSQGILENALFENTRVLQDLSELSYQDLYSVSRFLKSKGESLDLKTLQSTTYTSLTLADLRKQYPLDKNRYLLYKAALEVKLSRMEKESGVQFTKHI